MHMFFLFLLLGSFAHAQDDDLSALETAILPEADAVPASPNRRGTTVTKTSDSGRVLDLRSVIEEGLRRNPNERIRGEQREQIDLLKTNLWQSFWLPQVGLELVSGDHRIDRIRESSQSTPTMGAQNAPTGYLGLAIDNYTLFNWGRDYLAYQNQNETLKRARIALGEARRRLKFSLITQYFNLLRIKANMRFYQEKLKQASFIHRFSREKLQLRKIRAQEYYQTRSEYLNSQTQYQEALFQVGETEREMAVVLGDDYQGSYRSIEQLRYTTVNVSMEEALRSAQEQSVDYRNAKLLYDNASRSYEKALKDNLPLPRFDLNLGTYRTNFDPQGTSWTYDTSPNQSGDNRNIEIVASINMRWTLFGDGGFFNGRTNRLAHINKKIAEISFFNTRRELEIQVRTIFKNLRFLEQKVDISDYQTKNAQKNYDSVLDSYMAGRASFPEIKLALDNLVLSQINSQNVKYDHLLKKLELSDFMGLEDLPGENFDMLAVK